MAAFTNDEYIDMVLAYERADCNAREARRIYQERYPNRRFPTHQTFRTTCRRLRETGNLHFREPRVNVRQHNVGVDERIIAGFDKNPTKSIRQEAAELGIGIWKVWSVLRQDERNAFHYTPVQALEDNDFGRRIEFVAICYTRMTPIS